MNRVPCFGYVLYTNAHVRPRDRTYWVLGEDYEGSLVSLTSSYSQRSFLAIWVGYVRLSSSRQPAPDPHLAFSTRQLYFHRTARCHGIMSAVQSSKQSSRRIECSGIQKLFHCCLWSKGQWKARLISGTMVLSPLAGRTN